MNGLIIIPGLLISLAASLPAQTGKECVKEIIILNDLNSHRNDTLVKDKSIKITYTVKVINQDDESTISNVKVYKKGPKMFFTSEQVTVYQDEHEALLILPQQKVMFLNSMDKKLADLKLTDAFFEIRNSMLDSCDVISCEPRDNGVSRLVLKLPANKVKRVDNHIETITYEYNRASQKILSVKITFDGSYKLKQMFTVYKDFIVGADYNYVTPHTIVLDKKGNLLPKYAGWEFADNRDQPKK